MGKIVAAINLTLDGFCDHTAVKADDEIHRHYSELLRNSGPLLYGRVTYQLMENAWPEIVKNPTGNQATDEFAAIMDNATKIVFSRTLEHVSWKNSTLKKEIARDEILALRDHAAKDLLVGSPGLIISMGNLGLIDEYQLCMHPVVAGAGQPLFKNVNKGFELRLIRTRMFQGGAILGCYEPVKA
jgi:dihydrofolate reductase